MFILRALPAIVIPLLLGHFALRALGLSWRQDRLSWVGWSWLAGILSSVIVLLAWSWSGLSYDPIWIDSTLLVCAAALAMVRKSPLVPTSSPPSTSVTLGDFVFIACLLVCSWILIDQSAIGMMTPVAFGDEASLWTSKARALYVFEGFSAEYRANVRESIVTPHVDYPLLVPLSQLLVLIHTGLTDFETRLPHQMTSIALLFCLASALRRVSSPMLAGVLLLIVQSTREMRGGPSTACADSMIALAGLVALSALERALRDREPGMLRLAAIAFAVLPFTKHEGSLHVIALCGGVGCWVLLRRDLREAWSCKSLAVLGPVLLTSAITGLVNRLLGHRNDLVGAPDRPSFLQLIPQQFAERFVPVCSEIGQYLWWSPNCAHLPWVIALGLLLFPRVVFVNVRTAAPIVALLALVGFALVYVGSPYRIEWHIPTSLPRLILQATPYLALSAAAVLDRALKPVAAC